MNAPAKPENTAGVVAKGPNPILPPAAAAVSGGRWRSVAGEDEGRESSAGGVDHSLQKGSLCVRVGECTRADARCGPTLVD